MPVRPITPDILMRQDRDQTVRAVAHLRRYFGLDDTPPYTGASFESIGGGGDREDVINVVTAEDIVSLSMLSIRVHGFAARQLLEDQSTIESISGYLEQIPADVDMVSADPHLLAPGSAADSLWNQLRKLYRFGQTTTSKLMARKRPRLIPIYDSVIGRAFHMTGSGMQWNYWPEALTAHGGALHKHLLDLRAEAGLPENVTALRVLDVVAWMEYCEVEEEVDQISGV